MAIHVRRSQLREASRVARREDGVGMKGHDDDGIDHVIVLIRAPAPLVIGEVVGQSCLGEEGAALPRGCRWPCSNVGA